MRSFQNYAYVRIYTRKIPNYQYRVNVNMRCAQRKLH